MTKEEWVALFQAINGRDPLPQEFMEAKNKGEFVSAEIVVTNQEPQPVHPEIVETDQGALADQTGVATDLVEGATTEDTTPIFTQENMDKLKETTQKYAGLVADKAKAAATTAGSYVKETNEARKAAEAYQKEYGSYFDGGILEYIVYSIGTYCLILFTLGLATPWAICLWQGWVKRHTVINGRRLAFDGTGLQLLGNWIKWFVLCLITLGIYSFWMFIKVQQWITKHTYFAD